jgi:hypothetical protein
VNVVLTSTAKVVPDPAMHPETQNMVPGEKVGLAETRFEEKVILPL